MAEKKNAPVPSAGTQPSAGMTKMDGVRRALAQLGSDAKPLAIRNFVKQRFNIDISLDVVSSYKKDLARRALKAKAQAQPQAKAPAPAKAPPQAQPQAKPKPAPKKPAPQKAPVSAAKPAATGNGKPSAIPLADILKIKELVVRLGAKQVRTLIDAFDK
jgi:hypothetical protein